MSVEAGCGGRFASAGMGHRHGQANALSYLGEVRQAAGDHLAAARDPEEALGIYRDIGHRGQ